MKVISDNDFRRTYNKERYSINDVDLGYEGDTNYEGGKNDAILSKEIGEYIEAGQIRNERIIWKEFKLGEISL